MLIAELKAARKAAPSEMLLSESLTAKEKIQRTTDAAMHMKYSYLICKI